MSVISQEQKGAVSIFIVVFTALLITIVSVSFARLMLREQQRAANSDLSQSAYDAALAGVEDAKRALIQRARSNLSDGIDFQSCNHVPDMIGESLDSAEGGGVAVGNPSLQQAYTCVLIDLETDDYIGTLGQDRTRIIPLRGVSEFDSVKIEWFHREDDLPGDALNTHTPTSETVLSGWTPERPPVMETQLIQTSNSFTLGQFDPDLSAAPSLGEPSNTNTLFLYPSGTSGAASYDFQEDDLRISGLGDLVQVSCAVDATEEYICSTSVSLPGVVGGGSRNAYLRLTPRYNKTKFRITLLDASGNTVQFDGVQPSVDSTGRASNLFRRVEARVEIGAASVPYPEAAVDVSGNFCKNFRVTDDVNDYNAGNLTCTP